MDNLRSTIEIDSIRVLQKYVAVQHGIKWYFALTFTFRKAASLDVFPDPPVVLHTETMMRLMGTSYEQELSKALEEIMRKIDTFERNGNEIY